jgi:NADPH-dependent 2,4-dienoyl-CoA reductase/sulfur reductase-like enzyme
LSICGLPFYLSGETPDWRTLADRTSAELASAGIDLQLETTAIDVEPGSRMVTMARNGQTDTLAYNDLIIASGATPVMPPVAGLDLPGVRPLHAMADAFSVHRQLTEARRVVIIGAGYIGCELPDALTRRQLEVTMVEASPRCSRSIPTWAGACGPSSPITESKS